MRRTLSVLPLILSALMSSCLGAAAQGDNLGPRLQSIVQGNGVTIGGRAHIQRGAEGTYIEIDNPDLKLNIAGFIPFGNQSGFPGLYALEGRDVQITGLVIMDGRAVIQMTNPHQLRVGRF